MYPEFETLDYNYQRSESGEHKWILQFRKFIVKQARYDFQYFRY
jgi:hypothetical protein